MKNRKGLSEVVAYVLLIVVAISLSLVVYSWLKSQLPKENAECPEVSLIIEEYSCNSTEKSINLTLKNRGFFDLDGFSAKISNKSGSLPVYQLSSKGQFIFSNSLSPNKKFGNKFYYANHLKILEIEITPIKKVGKKILLCDKAAIKQEIEGCS